MEILIQQTTLSSIVTNLINISVRQIYFFHMIGNLPSSRRTLGTIKVDVVSRFSLLKPGSTGVRLSQLQMKTRKNNRVGSLGLHFLSNCCLCFFTNGNLGGDFPLDQPPLPRSSRPSEEKGGPLDNP